MKPYSISQLAVTDWCLQASDINNVNFHCQLLSPLSFVFEVKCGVCVMNKYCTDMIMLHIKQCCSAAID